MKQFFYGLQKTVRKVLSVVYALYAVVVFFLLMLPVFFLALLTVPFKRITRGNLIYRACVAWADAWFFLIRIRYIRLDKPAVAQKGPFIYLANHLSYLDATIIPKMLRSPVRPLGKAEMSRIPIFGFIYRSVTVMVDRSNSENKSKSMADMKKQLGQGISVFIFPEGTFNETHQPMKELYNGAFHIAIETQTPIKPILILDSYDRMPKETLFSLNPGKCRVVFLDEIAVEEYSLNPDDIKRLRERVKAIMEKKLVEYNSTWIVDGPNAGK